ncbi:MAG: LysR family transcriptional regulator [Clostridia bacterium]|nr:LysR family transcriptional regulator [Clostridia bacterium]
MTIQQCKYILKIAECGSFNEAAKQLFVAQSSLSVSVKSLEQELKIKIFERSGNGICLTVDGAEFARYARQIVEQNDFILNRYAENNPCKRLYVSTQHYDFVADIFGKLLDEIKENYYRFSLREMKTHDVIRETETAYCDIGIIAIKSSDHSVMERYLSKRGLTFTPILKALPHVYLRKEHPLANYTVITPENLKSYPYVCYEQGEHNISFFTEEIVNLYSDKQVEISDRASLMNCLLATDCYTIGTGIMPSLLNKGRIVSIPFESDDFYTIGYILRTDRTISALTQNFIEKLSITAKRFQEQ